MDAFAEVIGGGGDGDSGGDTANPLGAVAAGTAAAAAIGSERP